MKKQAVIVGGLALLAAAAVVMRQRSAASDAAAPGNEYIAPSSDSTVASIEDWITQNAYESDMNIFKPAPLPQADANVAAMQETISQAEGTAGRGDPYRVCYGYRHTINSFADHPAVTGEWNGEKLPDGMCAAAGFGPGCVSTAAGKYQIKKSTWLGVKAKIGLTDFSPASQDAAAVELLSQRSALGPLTHGDFAGAVSAARKEWASLPGAGYSQGERSLAWLTDKFTQAGGIVA